MAPASWVVAAFAAGRKEVIWEEIGSKKRSERGGGALARQAPTGKKEGWWGGEEV